MKIDHLAFYIHSTLPRAEAHALRASAGRYARHVQMRGGGHIRGEQVLCPSLFLDQKCRDRVGSDLLVAGTVLAGDDDMKAAIQRIADDVAKGVGGPKMVRNADAVWEPIDLSEPAKKPAAAIPAPTVLAQTPQQPIETQPTLTIVAKGPAWVEIVDAAGEVVRGPVRRVEAEKWLLEREAG